MTTKTKSNPALKTPAAITAQRVIDRYDAIENLEREERRFYSEAIRRICHGKETADDKKAVEIISVKHGFDWNDDVKVLGHQMNVIQKYFGTSPESEWPAVCNEVGKLIEKEGGKLNELREKLQTEVAVQQTKVSGLQFKLKAMTQAKIELQKIRRERPSLFASANIEKGIAK